MFCILMCLVDMVYTCTRITIHNLSAKMLGCSIHWHDIYSPPDTTEAVDTNIDGHCVWCNGECITDLATFCCRRSSVSQLAVLVPLMGRHLEEKMTSAWLTQTFTAQTYSSKTQSKAGWPSKGFCLWDRISFIPYHNEREKQKVESFAFALDVSATDVMRTCLTTKTAAPKDRTTT
jgi:hypothetical protein